MELYDNKFKYENKLMPKHNIILILQPNESNKKESLNKLIYRFEEISELLHFLNENNENIAKFIYDNMNNIHLILYKSDEVINLNSFLIKQDLSNYFYLNLLIVENQEIINYSYSFDFINFFNKNNLIKTSHIKKFRKIINSKIILDLIKNYEGLDDYDEDEETNEKLSKIKSDNINIIKENIDIFKEIELEIKSDNIIDKKIDDLYSEIIINIIKSKKIDDYKYTNNIIDELELKHIYLTKKMFEKINKELNSNKEYLKSYIIGNKEDLLNERKINFYYILLKDIIKISAYMYQFYFILDTRKLILALLKSNELPFDINNINPNIKDKLDYIIKTLVDSDYYFTIPKHDLIKLKEILKYYKTFLFESKKAEINDVNNTELLLSIFNQEIIDFYIKQFNNNNIEKAKNKKEDIKEKNADENNIIPPNDNMSNNKNQMIFNNENISNKDNSENKNNAYNTNDLNPSTKQSSKKDESIKNSSNREENENNQYNENDSAPLAIENFDPTFATYFFENSSILTTLNGNENTRRVIAYEKIKYGKSEIEVSYDIFKATFGNFNNKGHHNNKLIKNCIKFYSFLKEYETRIKTEYKNNFNLRIELNFKDENKYNDNGIKNITCIYNFYEPITNKLFSFREENILNNGTNSNSNGFDFLLLKINSDCYSNIKSDKNNNCSKNIKSNNNKPKDNQNKINNEPNNMNNKKVSIFQNDQSNKKKAFYTFSEFNKTARKEQILELIRKVEKESKYNGFIAQLSNGYYVINKSDNYLCIFDIYFNYMTDIRGFKDHIFNICEKTNNDKEKGKENIEIILCTNDEINLIQIDFKKINSQIKKYNISPNKYLNCIEIKDSNYICLGYKGVDQYFDLFSENNVKKNNIINIPCFNSIKVNENIIALVSNSILPEGKDELIFYNTKTKSLSEIEGYSFVLSQYGLSLMQREEIEEKSNEKRKKRKKKNRNITVTENGVKMNRILLCACKKYNLDQKNGILIINAELSNNKDINKPFYDTDDFEVHCICPISKIENNNENYDNINKEYKKNIKVIDTEFFLVGGFDVEKGEGKIRLYKLKFSSEVYDTKIEYLQDIEFYEYENFEGFEGPINCIIQSKITGNIIINCYNGEIYLLTRPNIDYYLEN